MEKLSRRNFLKMAGFYGFSLLVSACFPRLDTGEVTVSEQFPSDVEADLEFRLVSAPDAVQIYPGQKTSVWRFHGEVLKGDPSVLVNIDGSYLGPIFHVRTGQVVRIHFKNELPEQSIVHWHGLHVPVEADGHPRLAIDEGETYTYTFEVRDRAGTYWYHPHPHGRTGPQVYAGLAGLFIIHDAEEAALDLPAGEFDLPLVLQDRVITSENQFYYGGNMMTQMEGFLGNEILVNGFPDAHFELKKGVYRFRLLNGSNSRIYKLAWNDGQPLVIIGTDGGLLESPIEKKSITLAPAQRVDLWVDLNKDEVGGVKELVSLPHSAPGGRGTLSLLKIDLMETADQTHTLPDTLSTIQWQQAEMAVNRDNPREFELSMGRGMQFMLNRKTFEMEAVAKNEKVTLGDLEIWEFENTRGGMGMMNHMDIPHPMHIHGLQFQVLERDWNNVDSDAWQDLAEGIVDEGWHDTVLVLPGEKVKLLMRFEDFTGLYLYHCHNLEHEDMGMMRNYLVSE